MTFTPFPWKNKGEAEPTKLNRQNLNAAEEAIATAVGNGEIAPGVLRDTRGTTAGDLLLFNGTSFVRLPKGSNGQYITVRSDGTVGYLTPQLLDFRAQYGAKCDGTVRNCGTTLNSFSVTCVSAETAWVGRVVTGPNVPRSTTVESVVAGVSFTMTKEATATGAVKLLVGSDDSGALNSFLEDLIAARGSTPSDANAVEVSISPKALAIPPGICVFAEPVSVNEHVNYGGLVKGAGRGSTFIVFAPKTANQSLLTNNQSLQFITWQDITWQSSDSTAQWLNSIGPFSQNYVFDRQDWRGTWKHVIALSGSNNNSEFEFNHCGFYGAWESMLYSPTVGGGGSDQYLNFRFYSCQAEYPKGNLIDMSTGGSIDFLGGSLIHKGNGEEEQIFFALRGESHSGATTRLNVSGARIEHRHARSKLVYCEWENGDIRFESVDGGADNTVSGFPPTTEVKTTLTAEIAAGTSLIPVTASGGAHPFTVGMQVYLDPGVLLSGEAGVVKAVPDGTHIELVAATANIHLNAAKVEQATRKYLTAVDIKFPRTLKVKFDTCELPGQHRYWYSNAYYEFRRTFIYDTCRLLDWEYTGEFIQSRSNDGSENGGNKPPVKFRDCTDSVGAGGWKRKINGTVNGNTATGTNRELHTVEFKTREGQLPSTATVTNLERFIHKEAVIVAVRSRKGAVGTNTSKTWVYKLLDESNGGAVIAEVKGNGTVEWKTGWNFEEKLNLHMTGATPQWSLKLTEENVVEGNVASWFEVDYIA
jgi:hypothetical protein